MRLIRKFPSPCGVWVVSAMAKHSSVSEGFRPLAGCGLFRRCSACATHSMQSFRPLAGCGLFLSDPVLRGCSLPRFRPLAGCGLFPSLSVSSASTVRFRPLAGCGSFRAGDDAEHGVPPVSVPLRGVGCFASLEMEYCWHQVSVPLRGVGCFVATTDLGVVADEGFRPLAGCGLFPTPWKSTSL